MELNFSEHISPIIYQNCVPCHRKDGGAPFELNSYQAVRKRSKMIAYVTKEKYMPPWPADPNYRHFLDEKTLTETEIELIQTWHKQGAKQGNPALESEIPEYSKSNLGEPDLIVKMPERIPIIGNNTDRFLIAKMPYEIPSDTFVRHIEFVPGNRRFVHHMNGHVLQYFDPKDVWQGKHWVNREEHLEQDAYHVLGFPYPDGSFPTLVPSVSNYLPGVVPPIYPDGIGGFRITKQGLFYLNDIHYGPSPIDTFDQSYFRIYYDEHPPKRPLREFQLGTQGVSPVVPPLVIPPNEIKSFRTQFVLPQSISLLTVNPHMHLLGKSMKAYAIEPHGDTIPLIHIPEWNFRWQYFYTYPKIIKLEKGTTLIAEAVFDNTINNPDIPFDPPKLTTGKKGSMKTTDEMFQLIMTYLPYQSGDELISLSPD
ncbi:MAG: hypothetical protein ACPG4W_01930 [Flavobacteriales bacterium]